MRDFIHNLKFLIIIPILIVGSFLFCLNFINAEEINDFSVDIKVQQNSSIEVEEIIAYDFGKLYKHGIYRDIPIVYTSQLGHQVKIDLKVKEVSGYQGKPYQYTTQKQGNNLRIKIGDPDQTITGKHVYKIVYQALGVINSFEDHDELYWNITGNAWPVPISYVQARVTLPQGSQPAPEDLQIECFTGHLGSKEKNCLSRIVDGSMQFFAQELPTGQGLTIVTGWPKGIIQQPSGIQKFWWFLKANPVILLPILTLVILLTLWYLNGRDEPGKGTIVPQYKPPRKLTPAEIGVVIDEAVNKQDITCTIIDLARKGYYKIREIKNNKSGIFKHTDWEFVKLKEGGELLEKNQHEWEIFNGLFGSRSETIKLSELTDFHLAVKNYKKALYAKTTNKKYFFKNPERVRIFFFASSFGVIILVFLLTMLLIRPSGLLGFLSFILAVLFSIIFSKKMPRKTRLGRLVYEEIKGFRMFLSATEKDRVKFHFSPQASPEKFAEYVPYAIALGVEKQWAKVFENISIEQPSWYQGKDGQLFNSLILITALNNFSTATAASLTPKGSAAASGGSGFGGGGFSGGGFGGGGGGSW